MTKIHQKSSKSPKIFENQRNLQIQTKQQNTKSRKYRKTEESRYPVQRPPFPIYPSSVALSKKKIKSLNPSCPKT